ncbi:MAG TPA: hypothetical protein VFT74_02690, partial [Isosphaeraceae bacterium]|nr:hypothetical protein [Isosphaeraceae bacterium]
MDRRLLLVGLLALVATGCSTVTVTRDPAASDNGIRFYRPKPYLLVTPADPTGRMVNLKLEYLPDFNEEYSAHLKGKKAKVELQDGWNLVAAGVGAAPPPPSPKEPAVVPPPDPKLPAAVVAATNVPMGYYESVYDVYAGRKIFKGWRYIGFLPLGGPTTGPCAIPGMTPGPNPNCA